MRSYLSSRRRASEPEKPEPRFHWRTRVNSLMSEEDAKLSFSYRKTETSPLPIDPARDGINANKAENSRGRSISREESYKDEVRTFRGRLGFERQSHNYETEERRREQFIRTNSDSRLKMRVRFQKDDDLETSRSLDAADENNDLPTSPWRARLLRRSRSKEKTASASLDRSEQDKSDIEQEIPDDYIGACGGSFDSGLDLRISSSPEDDDEDFMEEGIQREAMESERDQIKNPVSMNNGLEYESMKNQPSEPKLSYGGGAIPKKINNNSSLSGTKVVLETKPSFSDEVMFEENLEARNNHKQFESFNNKTDFSQDDEKDYFREPSPARQPPRNTPDQSSEGDHTGKESTPPYQRPGFSFFSNDIEGIEDIIQNIISEEESNSRHKGNGIGNSVSLIEDEELRNEIVKLQKNIEECNEEGSDVFGIGSHDSADHHNGQSKFGGNRDSSDHGTTTNVGPVRGPVQDNDDDGEEDSWACVPKILLEDIFTLLAPKDRHQASQVCRQWYDLFYSPRVWETFILLEKTLTKKRFNLYKGYQRELCPWKTQLCLRRVGSFFKRIVITPITDYFNLFEFLRILAAFLQYQEEHGQNAMPLLHTFDFTFACATRGQEGVMVHGTGGQILDMIVKLLIQMSGLKHLKLNQLLTDVDEVPDLFSALTSGLGDSLHSLEMLNVTKVPLALTELSQFQNLIKLVVSPQHLNEEVLILLAGLSLLHLHLLQDVYTCHCDPVPSEAWKLLKEMAPWMRVYIEVSGLTRAAPLIQPRAPVHGIFMRTPFSRLNNDLLTELVEHYSKTLRYLVQERLPRVHGPRNFDKRCDSSLLFFVRRCPSLHTLVIAERISTSTLILVAKEGKNLNTMLVRQNGLIKRCDWSSRGEWSREFYQYLKSCALDYDKCTSEICTLLRHRWQPLTDKQFMRLKIVPKVDIF